MSQLTLESLGRPLVYEATGLESVGLTAPIDRLGRSVRCWVRSLDGVQKEGVTLSSASGQAWRFASDEGLHLGGHDDAPNPLGYVGTGMAAAIMTELLVLAQARGIRLKDPVLVLESFYYREGSFPRGTMTSGALPPEVSLQGSCDADPATVQALLIDAVSASPLTGLVRERKHGSFAVLHNGKRLTDISLSSFEGAAPADPGDPIAALGPAADYMAHQPLARKSMSEEAIIARLARKPEPAPVLEGGRKLLHLRTACRLREDGVYECLREQYAQPSSSWTFLVDDRSRPGAAIAPDSASVFAIGLAFCFMTQIGRYAHMAKLELGGYRVVQDLHTSAGCAAGGGAIARQADPVETHVFLDSTLEDAVAADVLRVAEQTCFLHALCRDELRIRVRQHLASRRAASMGGG
jgi:uncharacterized OsmC-like protein